MSLEKRTKNDIDTDKKPKIYFTCHPDDFEMCFDKICEDIFRTHDCAIFYKSDMSLSVPEKDRELDLKRNNLFVIPVTEKLLSTYNCTMSEEFPYALKENIPVLPILMEEVPDELYSASDNFGDLQYLNAVSKDDTAISYEEKLRKYLDSVLISEDLANRIRATFDAYIFLSYRKKDRRHANELMRLIHSNPECRDIAIWFDEFLTPGESFNENIEKILDDCELFTLLVTPQLLEKITDENGEERDNYVISTELPLARKMKAEKGTDILAVEMEETDKEALISISIDDCVNARDEEGFRTRLLKSVSKIAHTENDNEPEHNFLIGLAYLEGIDVEVDRGRAAELITGAAEDGLPEAMIKLISMYTDGIGVERNQNEVIKWSEKLSDNYFSHIFAKNGKIKSKKKINELFSFYGEKNWEYVIRSFLLKTDSEIPFDTVKTLYEILMSYDICEYTLLFETGKELRMHKNETQCILVFDILVKSANGTYPPYGPLFWYVPEYGLYEELLIALDSMKENKDFTNALALTRDVCRIFGHYNEITEITQCIDGKTLLCNAALSGVRKGLCELFFSGYTDSTDGSDIYPRCFNIEEAKSWKETGCGIHGRMPVPFEDELGLYSHDSFTELNGEFIGIISAPYDIELIESALVSKSCKKLCGLFLSPTENNEMKELAINGRHIKEIYIPENSEYYKKWKNLSKNTTVLDDGIIYFCDKVVLPDCVTRVNAGAFLDCSALKSIILPDGIKEIGDRAFEGCRSLTSINLSNGITKIGEGAFSGCSSLPSITLPKGITKIGRDTFSGCSSMTSVILSDGITEIGGEAFDGCSSLRSITLPDGITEIGESAFSGCSSLTSITLPDGITEIGDSDFCGCSLLTSITLPAGIIEIGSRAFSGCSLLISITLPDGITEIGDDAFAGCSSLESINLPDGITEIGVGAFNGCSSLTSITLPDGITEIGGGAFFGCSSLTSITLSDGITKIGEAAFYVCSSLESINLPDGITEIGKFAFSGCSSLTSISFPDSVRHIGYKMFNDCPKIKKIDNCPTGYSREDLGVLCDCNISYREDFQTPVIPDGTPEIADCQFIGRRDISQITIPDSVKRIGYRAFEGCSSLTSIALPAGIAEIGVSAFEGCSLLTSITLPAGIAEIGVSAFEGCSSLTSITLPDGITKIGRWAFWGCSSLTSITLPAGITKIGDRAFWGCSSLTSITLPESITEIGELAFWCCSSLTSITLPESITEIGEWAFYGCRSLLSIILPYGITEIGRGAFNGCSSMTSVILSDGITEIGRGAFAHCSSLTSITLPDGITRIGDYAFNGCSSLTSIILPDDITEIGGGAFMVCSSLTLIKLPDSITEIGVRTFMGCSSLASISLPQGITKIDVEAFKWCSSLTSITIPASVRILGDNAFNECTGLREITIPIRFEEELPKIFSDVDLSQLTINWI